ncbi:MAG: hypothetical protein HYT62_03865 [Candidatus Yanofskybacteria bacterium]|nr:hypothetical protein [Candidatus Yanofskybacteria bacterium]
MEKINSEKGFVVTTIVIVTVIIIIVAVGLAIWLGFRPGVPQPSPTPVATGPQRTSDNSSAMVPLSAQNNSGLNAKYQITAVGSPSGISSQTRIILTVMNAPQGISMPAHIHSGSCANLGAVKYPLTNVVGGTSVTTIDASILQLKLSLPLAINIHKSISEPGVYVACADLNADGSLDMLYNSK